MEFRGGEQDSSLMMFPLPAPRFLVPGTAVLLTCQRHQLLVWKKEQLGDIQAKLQDREQTLRAGR